MLKGSRRADAEERQLQRRESEAGHLTQKQAYTEQALQDLHEQHTQAAARCSRPAAGHACEHACSGTGAYCIVALTPVPRSQPCRLVTCYQKPGTL